jgi:hypothetical protein
LLTELLRKLLDFPALFHVVAPGVVYRALRTALITARGLLRPFVTTWATTPTSRSSSSDSVSTSRSSSSDSGSTSQQLVVAANLLFLLFVFATALSSDICIGLADLPCL